MLVVQAILLGLLSRACGGYTRYLCLEAIQAGPLSPVPTSGAVRRSLKLLHAIPADLAGSTARAAGRLFGRVLPCRAPTRRSVVLAGAAQLAVPHCPSLPHPSLLHTASSPPDRPACSLSSFLGSLQLVPISARSFACSISHL